MERMDSRVLAVCGSLYYYASVHTAMNHDRLWSLSLTPVDTCCTRGGDLRIINAENCSRTSYAAAGPLEHDRRCASVVVSFMFPNSCRIDPRVAKVALTQRPDLFLSEPHGNQSAQIVQHMWATVHTLLRTQVGIFIDGQQGANSFISIYLQGIIKMNSKPGSGEHPFRACPLDHVNREANNGDKRSTPVGETPCETRARARSPEAVVIRLTLVQVCV